MKLETYPTIKRRTVTGSKSTKLRPSVLRDSRKLIPGLLGRSRVTKRSKQRGLESTPLPLVLCKLVAEEFSVMICSRRVVVGTLYVGWPPAASTCSHFILLVLLRAKEDRQTPAFKDIGFQSDSRLRDETTPGSVGVLAALTSTENRGEFLVVRYRGCGCCFSVLLLLLLLLIFASSGSTWSEFNTINRPGRRYLSGNIGPGRRTRPVNPFWSSWAPGSPRRYQASECVATPGGN